MKTQWTRKIEDLMVAVTFAEKNQHDTAVIFMKEGAERNRAFQMKRKGEHHQAQRPQMRF